MMRVEIMLAAVLALSLGGLMWWMWSQQQLARRQIEMQRELAKLGQEVTDVAHDLQNLLASISVNVMVAKQLPPGERAAALDDLEQATWSASRMVAALRSQLRSEQDMTSRTLVELHAALLGRLGVRIDVQVEGDLLHDGDDVTAERVVQNLLGNAVRASLRQPAGFVQVELTDHRLTISNPIDPDTELGPEIWEREVSGDGSSGIGLPIVRSLARSIGWTVWHEMDDGLVHFVVERSAAARRSGVAIPA